MTNSPSSTEILAKYDAVLHRVDAAVAWFMQGDFRCSRHAAAAVHAILDGNLPTLGRLNGSLDESLAGGVSSDLLTAFEDISRRLLRMQESCDELYTYINEQFGGVTELAPEGMRFFILAVPVTNHRAMQRLETAFYALEPGDPLRRAYPQVLLKLAEDNDVSEATLRRLEAVSGMYNSSEDRLVRDAAEAVRSAREISRRFRG